MDIGLLARVFEINGRITALQIRGMGMMAENRQRQASLKPLTLAATEDSGTITLDALKNASDAEHSPLSVVGLPDTLPAGITYSETSHSFTLDTQHKAFQSLKDGETTTIKISYGVSDGTDTTAQTASFTVTGTNDPATVSVKAVAAVFEAKYGTINAGDRKSVV